MSLRSCEVRYAQQQTFENVFLEIHDRPPALLRADKSDEAKLRQNNGITKKNKNYLLILLAKRRKITEADRETGTIWCELQGERVFIEGQKSIF